MRIVPLPYDVEHLVPFFFFLSFVRSFLFCLLFSFRCFCTLYLSFPVIASHSVFHRLRTFTKIIHKITMGRPPTPCTRSYCSLDITLIRRMVTVPRLAFRLLLAFFHVILSWKKLVQVLKERLDGTPGEVAPAGFRNDDPVVVEDSDVFLLCGCFPKLD